MNIAKAYDDYRQSIASGWAESLAFEHACFCHDVTAAQLRNYIDSLEV